MAGRNLIVCSDGTGNSSAKLFKSNVWRIYEALDLTSGDQVALYDDGVGTAAFRPLALLGGAFGWGLKRNVRDLYLFLSRNYREGDRIFAFGFSRGAFTVRVLANLIAHEGLVNGVGVPARELTRLATEAFRRYRRHHNPSGGVIGVLQRVRDGLIAVIDRVGRRSRYDRLNGDGGKKHPDIEFVGVWDTVDAYGLPMDELTRGWDQWVWPLSFPDINTVPPRVHKACQAVALDDERHTFHPLLWDESKEPGNASSTHVDQERVSQVWFPGMHSDVGGSYPDDGLAHTALVWMAEQAVKRGLRFQPHLCNGDCVPPQWRARVSLSSPMHDSRTGLAGYYRYNPRHMKRLCLDAPSNIRVARPKVHNSVLERIASGVDEYAPIIFPERYAVVSEGGAITGDTANPLEHPTQALSRCHEQEAVWNLVWKRRIAYFSSVAVSLILLAAPFIGAGPPGLSAASPTLAGVVGLIGGLLPGFVSPWVEHYQQYPWQLVTGAVLLAVFMWWGSALQSSIWDAMRVIWRRIIDAPQHLVEIHPKPTDAIFRLRTHPLYRAGFHFLVRQFLPTVFGIAMLLTIVLGTIMGVHRVAFETFAISGVICRAGNTTPLLSGSKEVLLRPKSLCQPTGVRLLGDTTYAVTVTLPDGEAAWVDGTNPDYAIRVPSADGFHSSVSRALYFFVPLRRIVTAPWFAPIARVGAIGTDYRVLGARETLLTPRSDGDLFLFVNDAIWPAPQDYFYKNNTGGPARVLITVEGAVEGAE